MWHTAHNIASADGAAAANAGNVAAGSGSVKTSAAFKPAPEDRHGHDLDPFTSATSIGTSHQLLQPSYNHRDNCLLAGKPECLMHG